MKSRLYQKLLAAILLLACLVAACSKMDRTYQSFLKGGTIIYPGKADSLRLYPGNNRIRITWLLTSDRSITLCRIYWNNKADSVNVPVVRGKNVDTVSVIIDSLAEGYYNFEIYTYDKAGNVSVPADTIGQVFGATYAASLHNRIIKNMYWDQDTAYIFWYAPPEGAVGSKLDYQDKNGVAHSTAIPAGDTLTLLPDFKLHGGFQFQTGYLPDSMAIDTFYATLTHKTVDDTLAIVLPPYPSPEGDYAIINKLSGIAVAVEGAGTGNNANIIQSTFTYARNQLWNFVAAPTAGYYEINNVNSGSPYAIAVSSASTSDGAKLVQYKFGTSKNDQWQLEKAEGNYYKITNLKSQKAMEVKGSSLSDGATMQQNSWNGGDNQLFKLIWNLALNKTVTASSGGSHPGSDVVDGDNSTFWQANSGDRTDDKMVWVQIDLGTEQVFDALDQSWIKGNQHIGSYKVLYSNNGNTWKTAYDSGSTGVNTGENTATFPPVQGRYIKLELNFADDGNVNIAEVRVYYVPQ